MVPSLSDLRAVIVDLLIDLTILKEMAERQGDQRRLTAISDLVSRLRSDAERLKSLEKKEESSCDGPTIKSIEMAHRAFSDSYDIAHAEAAVTQIKTLFADAG